MDLPQNASKPIQPIYTAQTQQVRQASAADVQYLKHLGRKHFEQIGFLSEAALKEYVAARRVWMALENGEPAGYVLWAARQRDGARYAALYQAVIQYDARRRELGRALVEKVITAARAEACLHAQLWCAADLEAGEFWHAVGWSPLMIRPGGRARRRPHVGWSTSLYIAQPPRIITSGLRRSTCGVPILLPADVSAATILTEAKGDACRHLLNSLQNGAAVGLPAQPRSSPSLPAYSQTGLFDGLSTPTATAAVEKTPTTDTPQPINATLPPSQE